MNSVPSNPLLGIQKRITTGRQDGHSNKQHRNHSSDYNNHNKKENSDNNIMTKNILCALITLLIIIPTELAFYSVADNDFLYAAIVILSPAVTLLLFRQLKNKD